VLVLVRDAEGDQLPVEPGDLVLPLLERRLRPLERGTLLLERRPGLDEGGPLPLELTLGLLASGVLLSELLLHCDDRGGLVGEVGLQLLDLLGPLLGLALPTPRFLEDYAVPLKLGTDGDYLHFPISRHGTRSHQVFPRLLQRFIPVDESRADHLDGGGTLWGLALQLQEVVPQDFRPVRQPAVTSPQGLVKGIEGVALLLKPAELEAHLVKGAVPVMGADLQLPPSANKDW
jgi:hypothetical protein